MGMVSFLVDFLLVKNPKKSRNSVVPLNLRNSPYTIVRTIGNE
jgi:hypothetical protein